MNKDLSNQLTKSTIEHVSMYLDEKRLYDFFLSTNIGVPTPINYLKEPVLREEQNGLDDCCIFYPVLLIRNADINYVPKTRNWLSFFNPLTLSSDYAGRIQSENILVNMLNAASSDTNSAYSVLGMLEIVDYGYDSQLREGKRFVKPQLIVPGLEKSQIINNWESINSKTYSHKKSLLRF